MNTIIAKCTLFLLLTMFVAGCNTPANNSPVTTCTDGIQNQNETGVDCGGPCQACAVTPTGYYLTGQLGGVSTSASGSNAALPSGSSYYGSNGEHRAVSAGGVWYSPSYDVKGSLVMHKNFLNHGPQFTTAELASLYQPGTYNFCVNNGTSEGIELSIVDANNRTWYSSDGDNTGSTFTITSRGTYTNGAWSTTFEGTFSCKLYNNGNAKTFTGSFKSLCGLQ